MIDGFSIETGKLTKAEITAAVLIAKGLNKRLGKHQAITGDAIIEAMRPVGYDLAGSRLRKIVNYIRMKRMVTNLVASNSGYYRESDPVKIGEYMNSLTQRADAILAVRDSFQVVD